MRDIARAVGVRESALYHHFPNKNAILSTVLESSGPGALNSLMTSDLVRIIESLGPHQFLRTIGETVLTLWSTPRERHLLRLIMAEMPRLKEAGLFDLQAQVWRVRGRIGELFSNLVERGLIKPIDPLTASLRFMGPLMLIRVLHLSDLTSPPNLEAMRADLMRHIDSFWETVKPEVPAKKERRR